MTSRWRATRSRSLSAVTWREREYASAVWPSTSWQPFLMSSRAIGSFMSCFGQISTPPKASTVLMTLPKPELDVVVDVDAGERLHPLDQQGCARRSRRRR